MIIAFDIHMPLRCFITIIIKLIVLGGTYEKYF